MRQKEWLSDLEIGMLLVKSTRKELQALCLEKGKVKLLQSERQDDC